MRLWWAAIPRCWMDSLRSIGRSWQSCTCLERSTAPPNSREQDFTGKVLVLSPEVLREACWRPEDQLWLAWDGFGCRPNARGRSVRCTCLGDGEMTRWNRSEFVGILKDECLPDWAVERLSQLRQEEQKEPSMNEMTM